MYRADPYRTVVEDNMRAAKQRGFLHSAADPSVSHFMAGHREGPPTMSRKGGDPLSAYSSDRVKS